MLSQAFPAMVVVAVEEEEEAAAAAALLSRGQAAHKPPELVFGAG